MEGNVKLICLISVKNEAWCLDVFLKCASLWADYIIVADQNSTDNSREIVQKYPKVILIENNDQDYNEARRQKLLFNEARKIEGPKVFIALDADEIFTSNFKETEDWVKISNAQPGDVFQFKWANIDQLAKHYHTPDYWFQWAKYDDGTDPLDGYIHVARVPWPTKTIAKNININQFMVIHLQNMFVSGLKVKFVIINVLLY
jgi:glycosyltransferase involved in cell wall biosynthesis